VIRLADYTTLRLGGPAGRFVEVTSDAELVSAATDENLILGGGSNLVIADEGFPGTVAHVATRGLQFARRVDGGVEVTVAAGEAWDDVVAITVGEGLAGLECLSGIPGSAGATPIQNVGAYGAEVADTIISVRVYDRRSRVVAVLAGADCGFGYRTSNFKRAPGRYVVLGVTFLLAEQKLSSPVRYADLAASLGVEPGSQVLAAEAREAVLAVRRRKGMVIDPADPDTRSAGSFFTNPIVAVAPAGAPSYPAGDGMVKIPAAWLIEHAGFAKGYESHGARISSKHTLALTNPGGATTEGLLALAREIVSGVEAAYGIRLTPEPTLVGVTL
jgi:UDP-N-acetylmuramate dehydrogenase